VKSRLFERRKKRRRNRKKKEKEKIEKQFYEDYPLHKIKIFYNKYGFKTN